jgi:aspartate ammonia-lyase
MLQTDKDFVEIADAVKRIPYKLTKILSDLHLIVILVVYTGKK